MKKIIATIVYAISCIVSIHAQIFYGTTSAGGSDGGGTISKFTSAANNLIVAKSFESLAGNPLADFIQASDGKLYGMTYGGGSRGSGVIFSFDPTSSTYTNLKDFDNIDGGQPWGSLMQASDGKLYGMTYGGGSSGSGGVIFSFDPASSTYTTLKDFDNTNGGQPFGSLIQASDGKLYGMTAYGGSSGAGVIFSFDPSSFTYTKLKDFDITNGAHPWGSLTQASDGKLYGMTYQGGSSDYGVLFSFDPSASAYNKLKDFDKTNGAQPRGSLILASDGKLYGMTPGGSSNNAGVIFSFDPSASTYTKLKDFDITNGAGPVGRLMQASDGKLYGMTSGGGSQNAGVIFSFDPSASSYTKLKDFDKTNGGYPRGSLIQASDGKLYGMTYEGGSSGAGVIFSLDLSSSTYTLLKDFGINESGSNVSASLMQATDGKLYGMTVNGGSSGAGVIFSFDPVSSSFKKLMDFNKASGARPNGVIQASDGKLYGMTSGGGSHNAGVIFSFDPSSSTYAKLINFKNTIGAMPSGNMIQASDGKLYGITISGGSHYRGVIFSFDPTSSTYTKLKDFDDTNGSNPRGSLVEASDGKLYGMAGGGSNKKGVIFSFDPSSSTYAKLKDFDGTDGDGRVGSLMEASNGKLYGMTRDGGSSWGGGVIFSFDPSSSTYTKLKDFDYTNNGGNNPYGSLMQASDGKLYGMTYYGGSSGVGVIFSFDPLSLTYTKLKDYNGANGAYPNGAFIEVKDSQNTPPTVSLTTPANNSTYLAPAAHIKLSAAASDADGTISKVEFYNGTALLDLVTAAPYDYVWKNVQLGNYTLTAKAYDNSGLSTTSDAVHISVVPNKPPTVNIVAPENNEHYAAPAYIHFEAAASDTDGTIKRVEFYNGSTLLRIEYKYPYTYVWKGVPVGTYTITAVATDNWGAQTTSKPIVVRVKQETETIVSSRASANNKNNLSDALNLKIHPNPANQTLNIYTTGLQQNKPATISIISVSGIVLKKMLMSSSIQTIQLDVTSLTKGVYMIKVISGDKVLYKKFVKL